MTFPYRLVSQLTDLHPDSGWADCFESCLGTVALASGKIAHSLTDEQIVNAASLACRNAPDSADNAYTTLAQANMGLAHYGLPVKLSYDWREIINVPWGIALVDGTAISLADGSKPYPASWFNNETGPDHFVVFPPAWQGSYRWIGNPLDPTKQWREYDLNTVQRATTCAYLLPDIPGKPAQKPIHWTAIREFGLLSKPRHGATALDTVPKGGSGLTWLQTKKVGSDTWEYLQFRDVYGWTISTYIL